MAYREQYEIYLTCPNCEKQGEATWEEDESPIYGRGKNKELLSIADGFCSDGENPPKILCKPCRVPVEL
jgi:hypothetical protein